MALPADVIGNILAYACESPKDAAARRWCLCRAWLEAHGARALHYLTCRHGFEGALVAETNPKLPNNVKTPEERGMKAGKNSALVGHIGLVAAEKWLERNNDCLPTELSSALEDAGLRLIAKLLERERAARDTGRRLSYEAPADATAAELEAKNSELEAKLTAL